jgi:hypothetical protein
MDLYIGHRRIRFDDRNSTEPVYSDFICITSNGCYFAELTDVISEEVSDKPEALQIDWIGRNLFWVDAGFGRIEMSRLDGSCRRALITTGLSRPRGFAIDPIEG